MPVCVHVQIYMWHKLINVDSLNERFSIDFKQVPILILNLNSI